MDSYIPLRQFLLHDFLFTPSHYVVYRGGELIEQSNISAIISVKSDNNMVTKQGGKIYVSLTTSKSFPRLDRTAQFDICITLHDRIMLVIYPHTTDAKLPFFQMLDSFGVMPYTREAKYFKSTEPAIACIFTENGEVVKMSFTTPHPETMIEFF